MKFFSKPSKPNGAQNAQVYDFTKIELPSDAVDKELFKDSPSSTLETFYESPVEWVAKRRASRRLSLEVTKQPHQELSRSASAPFSGSYYQGELADELAFGKVDLNEPQGDYQTVKIEESQWKGVMPSEASVYDFTKVDSTQELDEIEDYEYGDQTNQEFEWVKANPQTRSGRRSMDVFVKSEQVKSSPSILWSDTPYDYTKECEGFHENNSFTIHNVKDERPIQFVESDPECIKLHPETLGQQSTDVFNQSSQLSDERSGAPHDHTTREHLKDDSLTASETCLDKTRNFSTKSPRFPDYVTAPIHRQKSSSTSFPDYQ